MRFAHIFTLSVLSLAPSIHSLPAPAAPRTTRSIVVRQNDGSFSGPQTVHTVNTANTAAGTVTTTCDITLTPVQGANGESLVQEEQNCQVSVNGQDVSSSSTSDSNDNGTTSSATNGTISSTTDTNSTSSSTTASAGDAVSSDGAVTLESILSVASATGVDSAAATSAASSGSGAAAVSADGFTTVTGTDTPSAPSVTGALASDVSAASSAISPSGTSADDTSATTSAAAFVIPGRSLSVLPIGLGVFAGISVIALIVVGLVTYERTKYRRAFRQRRLAEQGANMGYGGGMSQA